MEREITPSGKDNPYSRRVTATLDADPVRGLRMLAADLRGRAGAVLRVLDTDPEFLVRIERQHATDDDLVRIGRQHDDLDQWEAARAVRRFGHPAVIAAAATLFEETAATLAAAAAMRTLSEAVDAAGNVLRLARAYLTEEVQS